MLKRLLSLLILSILLFNSAGYIGAFYLAKMKIKKEMKMKLKGEFPKDRLKLILIDPAKGEDAALDWKDDNEFRLHGRMYDIISTKIHENGTIEYLCIDDEDETRLFANMDNLIKREFQGDRNKNSSAIKIFDKVQQEYVLGGEAARTALLAITEYPRLMQIAPHSNNFEPSTPPPENLLLSLV